MFELLWLSLLCFFELWTCIFNLNLRERDHILVTCETFVTCLELGKAERKRK
jgi:hypothetical protein